MDLAEVRALLQAGQLQAAAACVDALLVHAAHDPRLWEARAYVALQRDDPDTAIQALQQAVHLAPDEARWRVALGRTLGGLGRHAEAEPILHQAFRLVPRDLQVMLSLAQTLHALDKLDEAAMLLRRLVALDPVQPLAWQLLGRIAGLRGDPAAALRALERASVLTPDDARVQFELAVACRAAAAPERALTALQRAVDLDPRHLGALTELILLKRSLAHWSNLDRLEQRWKDWVALGVPGLPQRSLYLAPLLLSDPEELLRVAQGASGAARKPASAAPHAAPVRWTPGTPVRLGILLDDLEDHGASSAMVELLERLRILPVELSVFVLQSGAHGGNLRRRLQAIWPVVELTGWPAERAAQRMAEAGLHVLLDASGGAGFGRSRLLSLRPCARQWCWPLLPMPGAPGVHQAEVVDAELAADPRVTPEATVQQHRLTCCALTLDTRQPLPDPPSRAALGIAPETMVYAYFGPVAALSPAVLNVWAQVLLQVPASLLWIDLEAAAPAALQRVRDALLERGVAAGQLRCEAASAEGQVAPAMMVADVLLDPWPASVRSQALAAARCGVPVLTVRGATAAGRSAASLNTHQQMEVLNAPSMDAYLELAVAIGRNPDGSGLLRGGLQATRGTGSVLDMQHAARALLQMLQQVLQG